MRRLLLGALALMATLAGTPATARAGDVNEAMEHYERGRALFDEGAFDAALLEFERAYKIAPTYKLLYNIGQVDRQLNEYARALDAYQRYLSEGGAEVPLARQVEVRGEIAKLGSRVAHLQVKTNAVVGEVLIDDALVSKLPVTSSFTVNVGRRRVTINRPNQPAQSRVVDVVASETQTVDLSFMDTAPSGNTTTQPAAKPPSLPTVGFVVTGALGAGAVTTGLIALSKHSDNSNLVGMLGASPGEVRSTNNQARDFGITTDVLLGCTVVSAAVTGYFTYRYFHWNAPIDVALGPTTASLSGHF